MLAILAESALRSLTLGSVVWVGLHLFRVRNPQVQMTSWAVVLVASLAMPLLMHWTTVTVPVAPSVIEAPARLWPAPLLLSDALPSPVPSMPVMASAAIEAPPRPFDWSVLATAIYLGVAGMLLLRLAVGLHLTWRVVRQAMPLQAPWAADADLRISPIVGGPVTFGSTILLPSDYSDWDMAKRQAVLAHERAHVANRDFYLLLLAALNRAVFWFSPFAWWQSFRLAELAEMISDARALEIVDDRLSYAQILLDLVQQVRPAPAGLQMARASTVRNRVERILDGSAVAARAGWHKRLWAAAATTPVVIVSALTIAWSTPSRSALVADAAVDATTTASGAEAIDFYAAGSGLILAVTHDGDRLWGQLTGQRKFRLPRAPDGKVTYSSYDGPISWTTGVDPHPAELVLSQHGLDSHAPRIATSLPPAVAVTATDAGAGQSHIGWYELDTTQVLTVTRDGDRIAMQGTGRPRFELTPGGGDAFVGNGDNRIIFLRDAQAQVTQMLHYDQMYGARLAPRIDSARAQAIAADAARRIAEAPDRFRGQAPLPGSKEAVLRGIADLRKGTPNYEQMSAALGAKIRRQTAQMSPMLRALGDVESIYFRGVGPGGYDIYGVKFENGLAEVRLLLAADGKAEDVQFRPDGDNSLGHMLPCSREARLKQQGGIAPISVFFYNDTGKEMQLYELDADGNRMDRGIVGDDMSATVWTTVHRPWVVTDASSRCLQLVLPGLRTRFVTVEGAGMDHWISPRTTPLAGSEEMLRQYIESVVRGQPIYDHMTPQVAAYTRDQLPLNRMILSKLGDLQAVAFRGVSGSGNDVYMAHFTNGTAEWRIGLVKDRSIGRIALGPQY
ncbi:M56 family metallopeptidase [Tardiphaga sp.]|uniref:M56 family metallopeptidase n=1 Tax=Tardiphaga sp. TaxID=1926292 RepID=UPI0025FEF242|nr:M56 family metallopeptidase [Tardiphaga sp.]